MRAEIVVDGLGGEHGGKALGDGLQAVEGAVAADADQSFDAEFLEAAFDEVQLGFFLGIDVVAGGADEVPPLVGSSSGISW